MAKTKRGGYLITAGILMLACALTLTLSNINENREAEESAAAVVGIIRENREKLEREKPAPARSAEDPSHVPEHIDPGEVEIPDYQLNPDMKMPVVIVDGVGYIGTIRFPDLGLELPVAAPWSYSTLKLSPCLYAGTPYKENMVICGHNYVSHFGKLYNLGLEDEVIFTDNDGNVFRYEVDNIEELPPTAVENMVESGYALSLFTCTLSGQTRLTIRCVSTGDSVPH